MARLRLKMKERSPREKKRLDCVEIYLPKTIEFLSELYRFLRDKVKNRLDQVVLDGFSVYEVDGVFRGEKLWEQRTLVIRLLMVRNAEKPASLVEAIVRDLGTDIVAKVAPQEEEVWICHYPQTVSVFSGRLN